MRNCLAFVRKNLILFVSLFVLVSIVLSQAAPSIALPNRDSGVFLYFGRTILNGHNPYQWIWDNKPPGIFLVDALGLWLGSGSRWGVWFLEWILCFAAAVTGFAFLQKLWGRTAAVFASLVWLLGLKQVLAGGNLVEEYSLPFSFLALFFLIQSTSGTHRQPFFDFGIGATLAFSFLFRANNIGTQLGIGLAVVICELARREVLPLLKRIGWMAAGAVAGLTLAGLYFAARGYLGDMIQATLLYNFFYTGDHLDLLNGFRSGFVNLTWVAWVALAGYLVAVYTALREFGHKTPDPVSILLLVLWPVEIVFSSLSGREYEHYYINWLPSFALLSGALWHTFRATFRLPEDREVFTFFEQRRPVFSFVLPLVLILFYKSDVSPYRGVVTRIFQNGVLIEKSDRVSDYLRQHSAQEDRVLAWGGELGINFLSQRQALDAYFWYPLYVATPYTAGMTDQFAADLQQSPPVYIVDCSPAAPGDIPPLDAARRAALDDPLPAVPPDNLPAMYAFIENHYHLEKNIDGYDIYRLNS
jgi:hypothetical protein